MAGITIEPAFQEVELREASPSASISFRIRNDTNEVAVFDLSTRDFRQTEGAGIITFLSPNVKNYSYALASFISLNSSNVVVNPAETQEVQAQIINKASLSPGGHYGAIVAQASSEKSTGTSILPSLAALVLVRKVGGEQYALRIIETSLPKHPITFSTLPRVSITIQNEGNVHAIPYGTVEMKDILGRQIAKGNINTNSLIVFPESRREITSDLVATNQTLPVSIHTITIKGSDALLKTKYSLQESYLYVHPLFLVIFTACIVLIILVWLKKRKRRS